MEQKFCQSCGMPLTQEILGTNADGSKNKDYCIYCYKNGKFLQEFTVRVAVHAVMFILRAVGIRAEDCLCERHSAALTKFLFHNIFICYHNSQ